MDVLLDERPPIWAALDRPRLVTWLDSVLREGSDISVADDLPLLFEESGRTMRRLLRSRGHPAAHAAAREIEIETPAGRIRAAIIGAVATDPGFRRRGLGSRVIEMVIMDLKARGIPLAILWADVPAFYERLGFVLAGHESIFICARGGWRAIRKTTPRRATVKDLSAIRHLHGREACRVRRDDRTWRTLFELPRTEFYVIERRAKVIGYGVVGKGHDLAGCLHEWGGEEVLLPVIVSGIFELRRDRELYVMSPPWKHQAAQAMTFHRAVPQKGSLAMFKVLDRDALLKSLGLADRGDLPEDHDALVRQIFGCPAPSDAPPLEDLPVPFYLFGLDSM